MANRCEIRIITAAETHPLRCTLLREGRTDADLAFAGDDDADTVHFGAFVTGRPVGIASVYRHGLTGDARAGDWQLRGMAVEPDVRQAGCGRALVEACVAEALRQGGRRIWCNARLVAVGFYERCGFAVCSEKFEIPEIGPHYRMMRAIGASSAPPAT